MIKITQLTILLITLSSNSFAQIPDSFAYEQVFNLENSPKDKLFSRACSWVVTKCSEINNSQVLLQDKSSGQVIAKIIIKVPDLGKRSGIDYVSFIMQIDTRDNKYRVKCNKYMHEKDIPLTNKNIKLRFGWSDSAHDNWKKIRSSAHNQTQTLLNELNKYMEKEIIIDDF